MDILLLHQYFLEEDGAGGARFNELAKVWTENGCKVTVLAGMMPDHTGKKRREYRRKLFALKHHGTVKVWRCHVNERYNLNFIGRSLGYLSFFILSLIAGIFKVKGKFDLILVSSPPLFLGLSGYIISRIKRIPLVFEVRDLWPESIIDTGVIKNRPIIRILYKLENFIYKKSRLITVLTPAFKKSLVEKKSIDPLKIIYLPNAADFKLVDEVKRSFNPYGFRNQLGIKDNFVVLYVGAHGLANGLDMILDAAYLLKDTKVLFMLIGKGMMRADLMNAAIERKLDNVMFINPVPRIDIFKYILASDICLSILIKNETFKTIYSNKTFDYMACNKAILMAIDGISKELIENADAGCFVEPENHVDLVDKIKYYMIHPDILIKQGDNGYNFAKKNFDRNVIAQSYIDSLETFLNS